MYTFRLETEIQKPLDEVVKKFRNRKLLHGWHPGLLTDESFTDKKGNAGFKMTYKGGRRKLVIKEFVGQDQLPATYETTYILRGITNHVRHHFSSLSPATTLWKIETEYRFRGIMYLIGTYFYRALEKQSRIIMNNFKGFVENGN